MSQLPNVRRIMVEDFPEESRETVSGMAEILNSFMDDVLDLSRNNIDYANLARIKVDYDVTVDANGTPQGAGNKINVGYTNPTGAVIINVRGLQNSSDRVISTPYIDWFPIGNGFVQVVKVFGLPVNKKMRITIEFIK